MIMVMCLLVFARLFFHSPFCWQTYRSRIQCTMLCRHGALFCGFGFEAPGQWGQNAECFPGAFFCHAFSVSQRQPFSRFYPGCLLKIRKINAQKTHELCCVHFECSYCLCHTMHKTQATLLFASAASEFFRAFPSKYFFDVLPAKSIFVKKYRYIL